MVKQDARMEMRFPLMTKKAIKVDSANRNQTSSSYARDQIIFSNERCVMSFNMLCNIQNIFACYPDIPSEAQKKILTEVTDYVEYQN